MKKLVLVLSILGLMCGCGGGGGKKSTPPAISVSLAPATQTTIDQGQTLNFTATVTNDSSGKGVTWSVSGTGCSGSACGTFTNTTATTATYNAPTPVSSNLTVSVLATSAADTTKSASSPVIVTPPPSITTTSLANGTVGTAYSVTLQAAGGAGTLTWSVATGSSLPSWLSLSSGGVLSGTPTTAATSTFTVKVTDSSGGQPGPLSATQQLSLTIISVVSVSITSPTGPQNVVVNATLGITASVTGTSNTAVTWTVNGVTGGNATYGTISGSGLSVTYTAPASVPSPATFNITVTSQADPTKSASLSVTITAAAVVSISITSPTGPQSLAVNATLGITASVTGTSNTAVTWTVNGVTGGNTTYGTISGSGLSVTYTAPASVPSPATFNITVTSQADPTKSASVSVTITAAAAACSSSGNDSVLSGQYAFSLSGFNATGYLALVGSFTADGTGKITAGEADTNGALGVQQANITASASSYSVGSDNRGCATFATSFGTFTTRFALGTFSSGTATEGRVIEWETPTSSAYIAAGHILQQTASSFSSAVSSNYVFEESGVDPVHRLSGVGVISVSGGSVTSGELDMNDAGTLINDAVVSGTYTSPDTNGRFTMTATWTSLGPSHQVFYMVSSSQVLFSGTGPQVLVGEGTQQTVPAGGFTNSSLNGPMVFYTTGLNGGGSGGRAEFGLASGNGSGSLAVTDYVDNAGTWSTPNPDIFTCTTSVASNGRMTLSGANCTNAPVFYLVAANTAFMLGEGSGVEIGQVEPQVVPSGGFTTASFSGTSYMGTLEVANQAVNTGIGVVTVNSSGGYSITTDYTATTGQQGDHTETGAAGAITVNSNGTASIPSSGPINSILISSTKFVTVDNDSSTYPTIVVGKQ